MAKVTDLNGCFVKANGDLDFIKAVLNATNPIMTTGNLSNPRANSIYFRCGASGLIVDSIRINPQFDFKEIYFHDGEFYDCPAGEIPWTDGSIDEQEPEWGGVTMAGGEDVLWRKFGSTVEFFANPDFEHSGIISGWIDGDELFVIGYRQVWGNVMAVVQNMRTQSCSALHVDYMRKPETEAEKKTRETAEEVNRICFDLFGTPAFDCDQAIIDTVEKMVINGYKKG